MSKTWPGFDDNGDLPPAIHRARLVDVIQHFGMGTLQRQIVARRLERIYQLAHQSGQVGRFIIFGSFVTAKPAPNDVDIFLLMNDNFDVSHVPAEASIVFDHMVAEATVGASVFWIRRLGAIDGE